MAGIWGMLSGTAVYGLSWSRVRTRGVNHWTSGGIFQRESGKYGGNLRFAHCGINLRSFVSMTIEDNALLGCEAEATVFLCLSCIKEFFFIEVSRPDPSAAFKYGKYSTTIVHLLNGFLYAAANPSAASSRVLSYCGNDFFHIPMVP
jgi:hypothetical protein